LGEWREGGSGTGWERGGRGDRGELLLGLGVCNGLAPQKRAQQHIHSWCSQERSSRHSWCLCMASVLSLFLLLLTAVCCLLAAAAAGLAQAQADAMEPVLSQLVGRTPSMRSAAPTAPDSPGSAATPGVSTFVVSGRASDAGGEAGAGEAGAPPLAAEEVERMVTQLNQEIEQLLHEVEGAAPAE
jgi:hypothetical protein